MPLAADMKQALWPERWPLDCEKRDPETRQHPGLCCLAWAKETLGTPLYNDQYLCDPSGLVGRLMKTEWLEPYYRPPLPGDLELTAGVDLAFSEKSSADYTAIATVGYSPLTRTMYLVNVERRQIGLPEVLDWIIAHHQGEDGKAGWAESRIIIESNALQGLLVVRPLIRETLLPIIPRKTVKDKVTRILAITPYFETKKLMVRRDMRQFIDEYIQFPDGANDDMLDALELAVSDIVARKLGGMGTGSMAGGTFKSSSRDWSKWQSPYGPRPTGKEDPDKGLR